jgi:hypothetical protein
MPRSKQIILNLTYDVYVGKIYGPFYSSTDRQKYAAQILCQFLKRIGQPWFPKLDRPSRHRPPAAGGKSKYYRPAKYYALWTDWVSVQPRLRLTGRYGKFEIDLYEHGQAMLGRMEIKRSSDCRNYFPLAPLSHGEWLTAGSLRDSENFFFNYGSEGASGGSSTNEVASWFERAGYTDVHQDDNAFMSRNAGDISLVNRYFNNDYRVVLRINDKLLYKTTQADSSHRGTHFVILRSSITVTGQTVSLTVYTWGLGQHQIPAPNTQLSPGGFLEHWYGYVAAKPF